MAGGHFRNASWSGMAAAIRAGTGLLGSLLAIRLLGVEAYGHVATWLSLFVLYLALNSSAFTMLVVRLMGYTSRESGADRDGAVAAAVSFCGGSLALLAATTTALGLTAASLPIFGAKLPADFGIAIFLMGLLTALQIAVALQAAVIEGSGRLDLATKWQLLGPLTVVSTLLASFLFGKALGAVHYVALACAGAFVDLCALWWVRKTLDLSLFVAADSSRRLDGMLLLLRSGGVLQASALLIMFLEPANKFLLNHFVGTAAVTVYDLAMKVVWGIQHLFGAAMRVFLHIGSQDSDAVGRSFIRVIALLGVPVVAIHIAGFLFLVWAARYWMMIDASALMVFFAIAAISNFGMILITPLYLSLIGRRDLAFIFRAHVILAVANVAVSSLLIPFYGLIGSAIGLLVATALNVAAIFFRSRLDPGDFAAEGEAIRNTRRRVALATALFVLTMAWGMTGGDNVAALLGILLGLTALLAREPFVARLIAQVKPASSQEQ